jgi:hypothetical protein
MKQRTIWAAALILAAGMMSLTSCSKEERDTNKIVSVQYGPAKHVTMSAELKVPVLDKTYMDADGADYGKVIWETGDAIKVNNASMTMTEIKADDNTHALFEGTVSPITNIESGKDVYRSVYPASIVSDWTPTTGIRITIPATQTRTPGDLRITDGYMAAYTATASGTSNFVLKYKNLCTMLRIQLTAASGATGEDLKVSKIRFASKRGLSGEFEVSFVGDSPVLTPIAPSAGNILELDYTSSPITLSSTPTEVMVMIPAAVVNEGFVMQIWNGDGSKRIEKTKATTTLPASQILTAPITEAFQDWGGAISVSPTQKVYFAGGNLQHNYAQNKWRFAHEQYSLIPDAVREQTSYSLYGTTWNYPEFEYVYNTVKNLDIWIDLFCWGTSGDNRSGALNYSPANVLWSSNANSEDVWGAPRFGYGYGPVGTDEVPRSFSGVGESFFGQIWDWDNCNAAHIPTSTGPGQTLHTLYADWGYVNNAELNATITDPTKRAGTTEGQTWRTLSASEWEYAYNGEKRREIDGNYKCALGRIDTTGTGQYANGVFFIPDKMHWFLLPGGLQLHPGTQATLFTSNTYTYAQFKLLESYGVVFLPACGARTGFIHHTNEIGFYWSSTTFAGTTSYDGLHRDPPTYNNIQSHQHANSFKIYGLNDSQEHITAAYTENKYDGNAVRLVRNTTDQ